MNFCKRVKNKKTPKTLIYQGFSVFFVCKNPNFEMLRPPGVVFPVKGGRFFRKGGSFSNPEGVEIFAEGVA